MSTKSGQAVTTSQRPVPFGGEALAGIDTQEPENSAMTVLAIHQIVY